jgi:hypothetical protein
VGTEYITNLIHRNTWIFVFCGWFSRNETINARRPGTALVVCPLWFQASLEEMFVTHVKAAARVCPRFFQQRAHHRTGFRPPP